MLALEDLRDTHGLTDATISKHRLGYLPRAIKVRPEDIGLVSRYADDRIAIPPGIVVPVVEFLDVIGILIITKSGKCFFVRGSAPRPLDLGVVANRPVLVTTSPLLGLRLAQTFGESVGVRALGVVRAPRDSDFDDLSCVPKLVVAARNRAESKGLSPWVHEFRFSSPVLVEWPRGERGTTFEDQIDDALSKPNDAAPAVVTVPELATRRMVDIGCAMKYHARQKFVNLRDLDEGPWTPCFEPEALQAEGSSGDADNPEFYAIDVDGIGHTIDTRACSRALHEIIHAYCGLIVQERRDPRWPHEVSLEALASLAAGRDMGYEEALDTFLPFEMARNDRDLLESDEACPELAAYRAVLNGTLLRSLLRVLAEQSKQDLLRLALVLDRAFDFGAWTSPMDQISSVSARSGKMLVHVSLPKSVPVEVWCDRAEQPDGTDAVVSPLGRTVRVREGSKKKSRAPIARTARIAALQDFRTALAANLDSTSWMVDSDESDFDLWAQDCLKRDIKHDATFLGRNAIKVVGRTPRGLLLTAWKGRTNSVLLLVLRAAWESLRLMRSDDSPIPLVRIAVREHYAPRGAVEA